MFPHLTLVPVSFVLATSKLALLAGSKLSLVISVPTSNVPVAPVAPGAPVVPYHGTGDYYPIHA